MILTILPSVTPAAEPLLEQSHWSLEFEGGSFEPALKNLSHYFGRSRLPEYGASLAYKILPQLEAGVGLDHMKVTGEGYEEFHGNLTGSATYELIPVDLFVIARAVVVENQWVVPYLGGGFTRSYYIETTEGQPTTRGHGDGYNIRGGLQLSLDNLDESAASMMYFNYGVLHTSIFVEAEHTRAIVSSVSENLGGTFYRAGLLIEF